MVDNINGTSNLNDDTLAEYPSGLNGQTFSIHGGFRFKLNFTTTDVGDNGSFCLIQLITSSERILENGSYKQTSSFDHLPVLDGDVMDTENLWYSEGTMLEVSSPGDYEIILPDDPQTSPSEGFYGPPTALHVDEQFVIIFAKYIGDGAYMQLEKWTWGYSDDSKKEEGEWQKGNFKHQFEKTEVEIDLDGFDGSVRANNQVKTKVDHL